MALASHAPLDVRMSAKGRYARHLLHTSGFSATRRFETERLTPCETNSSIRAAAASGSGSLGRSDGLAAAVVVSVVVSVKDFTLWGKSILTFGENGFSPLV